MYCVRSYVILTVLPFHYSRSREEVDSDGIPHEFFGSVGAQVIGHFLCKWLDPDDEKGE